MPAKTTAPEPSAPPPAPKAKRGGRRPGPYAGLAPLAAELLRLQDKGKTYRQIAVRLCKVTTVEGKELKREPATVDQVRSIIRRARKALAMKQQPGKERD